MNPGGEGGNVTCREATRSGNEPWGPTQVTLQRIRANGLTQTMVLETPAGAILIRTIPIQLPPLPFPLSPFIPMQRLTCFLSGRVQGVGMRYAVHDLARNYPVTGFVENTQDGRVRMVIEGPIEQLDAMLERLLEIAPGHIRMLDRYQSQATGEFQQFVIQRFES